MASPLDRCQRCQNPLVAHNGYCQVCRARVPDVRIGLGPFQFSSFFNENRKAQIKERISLFCYRYGAYPVVSLFGLLPLVPVCSFIGIGAGVVGLVRIGIRRAPAEGVWFALSGIAGGAGWLVLALFIADDLGGWLQSIVREFFDILNPPSKGFTHV